MSFTDAIKKSVLEGFSYTDITTTKIVITLVIAFAMAMYIHLVYKFVTKNTFYVKSYGISMTLMSVVTAGIILAMQSSLVISLGMVGALSIVRFRTAIKDPMDLLFLFWSIGNGIICGAGLFELALLVALVTTGGIVLFQKLPVRLHNYLLVVNTDDVGAEKEIFALLDQYCKGYKTCSKNINHFGMDLTIEVKLEDENNDLLAQLMNVQGVQAVDLLENAPVNT